MHVSDICQHKRITNTVCECSNSVFAMWFLFTCLCIHQWHVSVALNRDLHSGQLEETIKQSAGSANEAHLCAQWEMALFLEKRRINISLSSEDPQDLEDKLVWNPFAAQKTARRPLKPGRRGFFLKGIMTIPESSHCHGCQQSFALI